MLLDAAQQDLNYKATFKKCWLWEHEAFTFQTIYYANIRTNDGHKKKRESQWTAWHFDTLESSHSPVCRSRTVKKCMDINCFVFLSPREVLSFCLAVHYVCVRAASYQTILLINFYVNDISASVNNIFMQMILFFVLTCHLWNMLCQKRDPWKT